MIGRIAFTNQIGGRIVGPENRQYVFSWRHCADGISPRTVGHSTPVEFDAYAGDCRAVNVRLAGGNNHAER